MKRDYEAKGNSLRILMLGLNQVGQGSYHRMWGFSQRLAKRGHQVTVMAVAPRARLRLRVEGSDALRLVETPDLLPGMLRSGWDLWDVLRRSLWLRSQEFDIVHAIESRPVVLLPALYAQRRGAALIMDWCDWFGKGGAVEERPGWLLRTMLRPVETYLEEHFRARAEGTVTINAFLGARAAALGVRPETLVVIRGGCDPDILPADRLESRRAVGLPLDAPLIGYAGHIYGRDAAFMADALNCLRRTLPAARLVLAGYFNRAIEPLLDDPSAVIRTGPLPSLDQVYRYLSACDLCWLPLRDSGANRGRWPSKLNDYMVLARPVVATAVGDLARVVPDYGIGLLAEEDSEQFAAQTALLLHDRERAEAMGRAARRAAEGVFSWERRTDELEAFYRRILEASQGRKM